MEDGVIGVSGVNAWFHVEAGKKPENVFVTTLNQNMMANIALVMLRKQHRVTKTLVQVINFYPHFIVDARRFRTVKIFSNNWRIY